MAVDSLAPAKAHIEEAMAHLKTLPMPSPPDFVFEERVATAGRLLSGARYALVTLDLIELGMTELKGLHDDDVLAAILKPKPVPTSEPTKRPGKAPEGRSRADTAKRRQRILEVLKAEGAWMDTGVIAGRAGTTYQKTYQDLMLLKTQKKVVHENRLWADAQFFPTHR